MAFAALIGIHMPLIFQQLPLVVSTRKKEFQNPFCKIKCKWKSRLIRRRIFLKSISKKKGNGRN